MRRALSWCLFLAPALAAATIGGCEDESGARDQELLDASFDLGVPENATPDVTTAPDAAPKDPVTGRVGWLTHHTAASGVTVKIGSKSVTTDAAGAFQLEGIATPYDIEVAYTNTAGPALHTIEGLVTRTPFVELPIFDRNAIRADVELTISRPGGFPLPADRTIQVAGGGAAGTYLLFTLPPGTASGAITLPIQAHGTGTLNTTIRAIEYTRGPNDLPSAWHAYGMTQAQIAHETTTKGISLALAPIASTAATMTVTAPPEPVDDATAETMIVVGFDQNLAFVHRANANTGALPFAFPTIAGARAFVTTNGYFATAPFSLAFTAAAKPAAAGDQSLAPQGPLSSSPAHEATINPTATELTWSPASSGGVSRLVVFARVGTPESGIVRSILTSRRTWKWTGTAPDPGTYSWSVGHFPNETIETITREETARDPRNVVGTTKRFIVP